MSNGTRPPWPPTGGSDSWGAADPWRRRDTPTPPPADHTRLDLPRPGGGPSQPPPLSRSAYPPAPDPRPAATTPPRRIEIGDVLNHTYEVRRFIARGGMGEVFEGVNVNAEDDKVAIKVMLPHLAADPMVQAMFSKEAKTLTRLRHPGLVQYRLLGREPSLGVTYIVTEFVDGQNLSDVLKTLQTTPADQLTLLRRLASALGAAHELDAVHRDISPDNVLLEGGRLKDAKIIDFGIAKDLDAGAKTIVGEGFAGKLGYVAPEQLGSYGRSVGPWTDVYSLALVMLAVAQKRDVDMGGSLADAFDKRKAVPDLAAAPDELRPILARMLEPDPANRLRSMDEVLARIDSAAGGRRTGAWSAAPRGSTSGGRRGKTAVIAGSLAALALAITVVGYFAVGSDEAPPQEPVEPSAMAEAPARIDDLARARIEGAREAVASGLSSIPCAWLDLGAFQPAGNSVDLALSGVAGDPSAAQQRIANLLAARGLRPGSISMESVAPIKAGECAPIDAFAQIRDPAGHRLSVAQRRWEMNTLAENLEEDAGKPGASVVIEVDFSGLASDATLLALKDDGELTQEVAGKQDAARFAADELYKGAFDEIRPGRYRIQLSTTHLGWSGLILLTGTGPFPPGLLQGPPGSHGPEWQRRFLDTARQRGWKAEMVWYKTVDELPDRVSAAAPATG